MACGLSANSCCSSRLFFHSKNYRHKQQQQLPLNLFKVRASSTVSDEDCNDEDCAPEKEVGKVSMEWLAGEKTKVVGTFPPRTRGWTGYVEKDTAGQTNIYSVEPAVYVAESAISSGNAGTSADGSENTAAIAAGLALIFIAAASSVVLQVGKKPTPVQTLEYSGPSLSYYINKFKPPEIIQASEPAPEPETSVPTEPESSAQEVSEVQVESDSQPDTSSSPSLSQGTDVGQFS